MAAVSRNLFLLPRVYYWRYPELVAAYPKHPNRILGWLDMALRRQPIDYSEYESEYYRRQHRIRSASDILAGDLPRPPALIEDYLLTQTLTMISAEPFTGKSLLSLNLAICLDTTLPFLGKSVRTPQKVLFVGQDSPSWDYAEQLRKLARGVGVSELGVDLLLNEGVSLTDPKFMSILTDWHNSTDFDVLILDCLSSMHSLDENDNRAMGVLLTILKQIRNKLLVTVIFTHHTSKPGDVARSLNYAARGATTISGSVDWHLNLRKTSQTELELRVPKGRGATGLPEVTTLELKSSLTPSGHESIQIQPKSAAEGPTQLVLSLLRQGPATRQSIANVLCAPYSGQPPSGTKAAKLADNILFTLARAGVVKKTSRGVWSLASAP